MTTTLKPLYGTPTAMTMTLASLANNAYRQSTAVDFTSSLVGNLKLLIKVKTAASGVSATGYSQVFVVEFDGTNWGNGASGTDASFTPDDVLNLPPPIWTIPTRTSAVVYTTPLLDVPALLGYPILGPKVAVVIGNFSGAAFDATGTNFLVEYTTYQFQNV